MKILIVGAGPIGCYLARLLKDKDSSLDIGIIEEHSTIGRPVHCAGLVSPDVLSQLQVDLGEDVVLNRVNGAKFFLDQENFTINRKDAALVIDREKFDRALGEGLDINFNTRFVGIEHSDKGFLVETDKGEYYADVVVGADGSNSAVRRAASFKEEVQHIRGVQFRVKYNKTDNDLVQVHLKRPFFAWIIPEDSNIARVGIISDNPYKDLLEFMKEADISGEILEKFAGQVSLGNCSSQKGNVVLVGDAACQVKPLTHGGVYYGMRCAEILADCIVSNRIPQYEELWRHKFNREIFIGLKIRKLYQNLSDDNFAKIFAFLKKNKSMLEEFGDFENHSKVISVIIKNPQLQVFLSKILIDIIREI